MPLTRCPRFAAMFAMVLVFLIEAFPAQGPTFRSSVDSVAVYATVRDRDGHLVPGLAKSAFKILEDGRSRDIGFFSSDPQPLSVAIMLDMSEGMSWGHVDLRGAILAFADALDARDRVSIGSFGLEIAVGANLTRDRAELARVLDEEIIGKGGGSPLWQAIRAATTSLSHEPGRRVVLVETDGEDSGGLPGFIGGRSGAERQALEEECMVYALQFESNRAHQLTSDLVALTEATGGGHFMVPKDSNLPITMTRLAEELRHQYLLGFAPAVLDGKVHKLDVRLTTPGLKATARTSYFARIRQ